MPPDKLEKLKSIYEMMKTDTITPKELESFLAYVLNFIKESKDGFDGISKENLKRIQEGVDYINEIKSSILEGVDSRVQGSEMKMNEACDKVMKMCEEVATHKPENGKDGMPGKDGENGKDGSPDTPEEIRNKLESLEGDDRLDKSAIRGLEEALKTLEAVPAPKSVGGSGKTRVLVKDISASLDGATKSFFVGNHLGIIGVYGSSSPFIFRPVIDYNETGKNIVFTDAVEAAISLAQGQSLIVQYLK